MVLKVKAFNETAGLMVCNFADPNFAKPRSLFRITFFQNTWERLLLLFPSFLHHLYLSKKMPVVLELNIRIEFIYEVTLVKKQHLKFPGNFSFILNLLKTDSFGKAIRGCSEKYLFGKIRKGVRKASMIDVFSEVAGQVTYNFVNTKLCQI